jgi:nucleotide-binding universal stress UspA family protein
MYQVLVPVDDDEERALDQAKFVEELPHASDSVFVTVAHAFTGEERRLPEGEPMETTVRSVRKVVEALDEEDIEFEVVELELPPDKGIKQLSNEIDANLIAMGGKQRSPVGKMIFGSETRQVIINSDRTVAVVGHHSK